MGWGRAFWEGNGHKGARRMETALYLSPSNTVYFSEVLLHRAEPLPAFLTAKLFFQEQSRVVAITSAQTPCCAYLGTPVISFGYPMDLLARPSSVAPSGCAHILKVRSHPRHPPPLCPSTPPGTCQIGPPLHLVPEIAVADLNPLR